MSSVRGLTAPLVPNPQPGLENNTGTLPKLCSCIGLKFLLELAALIATIGMVIYLIAQEDRAELDGYKKSPYTP